MRLRIHVSPQIHLFHIGFFIIILITSSIAAPQPNPAGLPPKTYILGSKTFMRTGNKYILQSRSSKPSFLGKIFSKKYQITQNGDVVTLTRGNKVKTYNANGLKQSSTSLSKNGITKVKTYQDGKLVQKDLGTAKTYTYQEDGGNRIKFAETDKGNARIKEIRYRDHIKTQKILFDDNNKELSTVNYKETAGKKNPAQWIVDTKESGYAIGGILATVAALPPLVSLIISSKSGGGEGNAKPAKDGNPDKQ